MAIEWFVKDGDRETGPFTVAQMKAQAAANRIKPDTWVRKGQRGKWFAARNVQGLLPNAPTQTSSDKPQQKRKKDASAGQAALKDADAPAKEKEEEGTFLAPLHSRKRRAIVLGCLMAFIAMGGSAIHKQLFFDLTMGLIIGSFPIIEVKKKTIEQTIFVLFYPIYKKTWRIRDFVAVEADVEARASDQFGCLVYVFFWYAFLWRFFDFLMPWLGGSYKLYLKELDDERMLIWQGSNTADYEANLRLFQSRGLRIS